MFNKKKSEKFESYRDPTGEFTNRSLKLGEWYLNHKILLHKIGTGILIAWCVVTMSISIGYFGYYLIFGYSQDSLMYAKQTVEFENYQNLQILYRPQELQVRRVQVFESAADKYDLAAQVLNPNERWTAHLDYKYIHNNGETEVRSTILLPGEVRPIIYFGLESNRHPSRAQLVFENISWKKVDPHYIKDVQKFIEQRKIFELDNFDFTRASRSAGVPSNIVEFSITNVSSYGYWAPEFIVELIDGQTVGYMYILEEQFRSEDTRHIDVRSTVSNLEVEEIKIYPIVNVFDTSQYMKPGE